MVYGADGYYTSCACIVFCPRISDKLDRLHIRRGNQGKFRSVCHLSTIYIDNGLSLSENLVFTVSIKHTRNVLDDISSLAYILQVGVLNVERKSSVFF